MITPLLIWIAHVDSTALNRRHCVTLQTHRKYRIEGSDPLMSRSHLTLMIVAIAVRDKSVAVGMLLSQQAAALLD